MGPLGDLRKLMGRAVYNIDNAPEGDDRQIKSDQFYMSRLFARQEYFRTLDKIGTSFPEEVRDGRQLPAEKKDEDDITEFHMFLDYESVFAMTMMHNDRFFQRIKFDQDGVTAVIGQDYMDEGESIKPRRIQMLTEVYRAFERTYNRLHETYTNGLSVKEWISSLSLSTNMATREIVALYHKTGTKRNFVEKHQQFWYMPYIKPLLNASVRASQNDEPINEKPIDGRMWYASQQYPADFDFKGLDGGFFTDFEGEEFIPFSDVCMEDVDQVFGKEYNEFAKLNVS